MKTKDVLIGLIVIAIVVTGAIVYKNSKKKTASEVVSPTPNYQFVENKFPGLKVPANADRASLNKVSGSEGMGEAFRVYENGRYNLTVMATLPDPKQGYFYQTWMVKDNLFVSIGRMGEAKGGFISEFSAGVDHTDYKKIVVTEERTFDGTPETKILEGSF